MKTLSQKQLRVLGSLSTQAYRRLCKVGATGGQSYEEWRHGYTALICAGLDSWRALTQQHYIPLCNAFLGILGKAPMADNTPKDDAAALIHTIKDRVEHWEAPLAYVARIVANKTGRDWVQGKMPLETQLGGLDCQTLRQLLYTIERACRNRAKRECEAMGCPPPVEVHASRSTVPPKRLAQHRGDVPPPPLPPTRRKAPAAPRQG